MILELIKESIITLRLNLMRTILTMIGIILGVGAVVTIMTLGKSAFQTVEKMIGETGLGNIKVFSGFDPDSGRNLPLNDRTLNHLRQANITDVTEIKPQHNTFFADATNQWGDSISFSVTYADIGSARNKKMIAGRIFDLDEIESQSQVIIINEYTAKELFDSPSSAINQRLTFENSSYKVIGVYHEKILVLDGSGSGNGLVPESLGKLSFSFQTLGYGYFDIVAKPGADYDRIGKEVKETLAEAYGFDSTNKDEFGFNVVNVKEELAQFSQFLTVFSVGLAGIAAISLLVGGVGIMNIMLVSVTERTKEIGLLKALGAKDRDLIFQFLIESVVMTVFGGLIGVALGVGVSWSAITIGNTFFADKIPELAYAIDFNSIWISVSVSIVIGLIFGVYPARKAAALNPVEALRRD